MPRTLPILDLSSWREGDRASLARIGAEVGAACRDVGFFYVVNHGVDRELIDKSVRAVAPLLRPAAGRKAGAGDRDRSAEIEAIPGCCTKRSILDGDPT